MRGLRIAVAVASLAGCGTGPRPEPPEPVAIGADSAVVRARSSDTTWVVRGGDSIAVVLQTIIRPNRLARAHPDSPPTRSIVVPFAIPDTAPPDTVARVGRDTLAVARLGDRDSFRHRAVRELALVDGSTTPTEWQVRYPDAVLTRVEADADLRDWGWPLRGAWCARAERRELLGDGRVLREIAFFYPPPAPSPPRLPSDRERSPADRDGCRLGSLHLDTREPDIERAVDLARWTVHALNRAFGGGEVAGRPSDAEFRWWIFPTLWTAGELTIVAGFEPSFRVDHRWMRVIAWLPGAGFSLRPADPQDLRIEADLAELREIVAIAGLDSVAAEPLVDLHLSGHAGYWVETEPTWSDSTMIGVLESWIADARSLEPRRRAAALYLADMALVPGDRLSVAHTRNGEPLRERLAALGAGWGLAPISHEYVYERSWLWEAWRLDEGGPIGERAFVRLLELGFDTGAACGERDDQFENVIERGEPALARIHDPDLRWRVHLALARAYGDVVTIASEVSSWTSLYFEVDRYRDRAPPARRASVGHYQAALDHLASRDRPARFEAVWREAWLLATGRASPDTHFACFYD